MDKLNKKDGIKSDKIGELSLGKEALIAEEVGEWTSKQ